MPTDVIVVGAGPVGLAMASELARYGVAVRVVDKNPARSDKSKALVLWARTLELMDRMGCTDRFIAAGLKIGAANIFKGDRRIAQVDVTQIDSPYKFALTLPQNEMERLLEEHLETLDVRVERSVELRQLQSGSSRVGCTLLHSDGGREEETETSWLIGCDGAHSTVRHQLGMEFHGETLLSQWILADVHLKGVAGTPAVNIFWHADGILALFPIRGTRHRVVADVGDSSANLGTPDRAAPTIEDIQQILDRRGPGGIEASDPVWLSNFTINERKVSDYRAGRVFLAGDAAHVHSPAGGQGMNTGIQDACNLAWKLALVSRGIFAAEPLLESYSSERSPVAKAVLNASGRATAVAVMKGGLQQSIRDHVASLIFGLAPVSRTIANLLSEVAIAYPHSPINVEAAQVRRGPQAGKRAPIREGEPPVGAGKTPLFALFGESTDAAHAVLSKYSKFVEPSLRKPFATGGIWCVRPDGYVSLVAKHDDWNEVDRYLARLSTGLAASAH